MSRSHIGKAHVARPHLSSAGREAILVAFSHSAASAAALVWALEDSRRRGCGLTVLHVDDSAERADAPLTAWSPDSAHRFQEKVSDLLASSDDDVSVRLVYVRGPLEDVLVEAARDCRTLVLGRAEGCRHQGLEERLRSALRCPVVVVAAQPA